MMIKEVDGKINGNIDSTVKQVSGNVAAKGASMSGNVQPAGQKIVYDAEWGKIKGDIGKQEDLIELLEGAKDYAALENKPSINGEELVGNKSIEALGIDTMSNKEILQIFNKVFGGN